MTSFSWLHSWASGGIIVERWVQECAAQMGRIFGLSGLPMAPFLFENWFRYRSRFCKMLNFRWIFPLAYLIGCQKVPIHPNSHGKKYWFDLKKGPSRNKWFRQRLQIFVFSGLVIGWWLKLGPDFRTQLKFEYPPPPEWACHNRPLRCV